MALRPKARSTVAPTAPGRAASRTWPIAPEVRRRPGVSPIDQKSNRAVRSANPDRQVLREARVPPLGSDHGFAGGPAEIAGARGPCRYRLPAPYGGSRHTARDGGRPSYEEAVSSRNDGIRRSPG